MPPPAPQTIAAMPQSQPMAFSNPELSADDWRRIRDALRYLARDLHHRSFAVSDDRRRLLWEEMESGKLDAAALDPIHLPRLPKTIDFTVDYLRSGLPRDAYARARVNRSGRRYASVHVEAWQDNRSRLFAQGTGHFLMPQERSSSR